MTIWERFALEREVAQLSALTGWGEADAMTCLIREQAAIGGQESLITIARRLQRQVHAGMWPTRRQAPDAKP